jgi:hypothetical protein
MDRLAHNRPELSGPAAAREARIREVTADVEVWLRTVCASLPAEEFAALTRRIAEVAVKYEEMTGLRDPRLVDALPRLADALRPEGAPI